MDGPPVDLIGGDPLDDTLEPENDLSRAYRVITQTLEALPLGVGMSLVTNVLADLLIEASTRQGLSLGPSAIAKIGRDGLFAGLSARARDAAQRITLASDGRGGIS